MTDPANEPDGFPHAMFGVLFVVAYAIAIGIAVGWTRNRADDVMLAMAVVPLAIFLVHRRARRLRARPSV